MTAKDEFELFHTLPVEKIPAGGITKTIEAKEVERHKLAVRFGLLELPKLRAELTAQSARAGQAISVKGHLTADVVQRCGITNEPVPDHIEYDIDILYMAEAAEEEAESFVDPTGDEVEPIINGVIDLGELIAQNLGIALNPYPRKAGAVFQSAAVAVEPSPVSPLAKLAEIALKKKEK